MPFTAVCSSSTTLISRPNRDLSHTLYPQNAYIYRLLACKLLSNGKLIKKSKNRKPFKTLLSRGYLIRPTAHLFRRNRNRLFAPFHRYLQTAFFESSPLALTLCSPRIASRVSDCSINRFYFYSVISYSPLLFNTSYLRLIHRLYLAHAPIRHSLVFIRTRLTPLSILPTLRHSTPFFFYYNQSIAQTSLIVGFIKRGSCMWQINHPYYPHIQLCNNPSIRPPAYPPHAFSSLPSTSIN